MAFSARVSFELLRNEESLSCVQVAHELIIQGVQDIEAHAHNKGLHQESAVQHLAVGQAVGGIAEPAD